MTRRDFYVLKQHTREKVLYKQKVNGVEFEINTPQLGKTLTIRAYIDEDIHRMYFIDPDTGVSFADYTFPFEWEFDREKHLQHATLYLDADLLAGYIRFLTHADMPAGYIRFFTQKTGTSNAAIAYKKLKEEYEKAGICEI